VVGIFFSTQREKERKWKGIGKQEPVWNGRVGSISTPSEEPTISYFERVSDPRKLPTYLLTYFYHHRATNERQNKEKGLEKEPRKVIFVV